MATPSTLQEEIDLVNTMRVVAGRQIEAGHTPGRPHWNETSRAKLEKSLQAKLVLATFNGMTWELAADIANYAAMLADNQAGS